ncbi:MAG: signal recognition particle [Deltaproteobacteria bacterium]|nr:signal recognition particle [Deltaproteobacteria bacterium]
MAKYVDGYVLPVPRKNLAAYRRLARKAGKIWREHGALEFRECVGDDLNVKMGVPFPRHLRLKPGETVLFSWIVFSSRAHRDRVNAKVMKDERLAGMDPKEMPFDCDRMIYGGFKVLVEA